MSKKTNSKGLPVIDIGITKKEKKSSKGVPEQVTPSLNLNKKSPGELSNLNFKVSPEFKREFKMDSIENDLTQVDFLYKVYDFWKKNK